MQAGSPGFTPQRVVDLASRCHLQGYDALYSHLARSLGLLLATLDHGHRQAARAHNLTMYALA
jgi:predicted nucleic acid-binding protein